jgi:hypothetical protein
MRQKSCELDDVRKYHLASTTTIRHFGNYHRGIPELYKSGRDRNY